MAPFAVHLHRAVALVAGQAVHTKAGQLLDPPGEHERLGRRVDPGAMHARVDLDQDPDGAPRFDRRGRERLRVADVIDVDEDIRLPREERRGTTFLRNDELVRDQDVVGAGADHDDRLPDRRSADPERTVLELQAGDVRALVVLDVAAQAGMELGQTRLHVRQVREQHIAIDDERGRHDVVLAAPDRGPVLLPDTVVGFGDDRGRISHALAPQSPRSSMSRSQRDSGPRGRTGQMSSTRPSSMTW